MVSKYPNAKNFAFCTFKLCKACVCVGINRFAVVFCVCDQCTVSLFVSGRLTEAPMRCKHFAQAMESPNNPCFTLMGCLKFDCFKGRKKKKEKSLPSRVCLVIIEIV